MGHAAAGDPDAVPVIEQVVRRSPPSARSPWLDLDQIIERLGYAVDRVMGEGGLWDERTAARAFRQAEGDVVAAAHLVRTQRATLPPLGSARTVDTAEVEVESRGTEARRLLDGLRRLDLLVDRRRADDPPPPDVTQEPAQPGAPRSARLSTMAQAETGALVQLWYRHVVDPDRERHEVAVGEVRHGRLPVEVTHPVTGEPVRIGHVRVTEVEAIEDLDGTAEDRTRFDAGYGLCLGRIERKAIAMAKLDLALQRDIALHPDGAGSPLERSLLATTDGLESSRFFEHLNLPDHVAVRSVMEGRSMPDGP